MLLVASRDPNLYITRNLRGKIRQENCKNGGAIYLSWVAWGGWGSAGVPGARAWGRRGGNFERLLVQASVVERGRDETLRVGTS